MYSVLSLIDNSSQSEIQRIFERIRPTLQSKTPVIWDFPHFTWHSAEEYNQELLDGMINKFSSSWEKFPVRVTGIGIFTGKVQVLYLPIIKTSALVELQQEIYREIQDFSTNSSNFYLPDIWIPHITLISSPEEQTALPAAIQILSRINVDFEVEIDNLAVGQYTGTSARILQRNPFQK